MADSTSSGLRVDLLGAVQVTVDGRRLDIGGPKPRAVVTALPLAAGTPVAPGTLSAALWGATHPPAAAGTLRAYASRLRAVFGGGLLQRSAAGYVLGVAPAAVDALVFEQCVRSLVDAGAAARGALANPQSSRDLERVEVELLAVLGLWRGPALEDLRGLPLARAEGRRLEELRLEAGEAVLDLRLRRGAEAQVLRDLAPLLTRNPLREHLHAQRMVALYRSGRQTEALEAYARVRRQLAAERGLDPGPALQEVHRQVLEQDPALLGSGPAAGTAERALPSAPPSSVTRFVGRDSDVERVLACLATDRLVRLVGPGGGGKTRLALEVARRRAVTAPAPVLVVELAGVRDARHVLHAVAAALGPGTSVEPRSRPWLRSCVTLPRCSCWTTASTCSTPLPTRRRRCWAPARRYGCWLPVGRCSASPVSSPSSSGRWLSATAMFLVTPSCCSSTVRASPAAG